MTVPKVPFRITKICGLVNVEKETAVYFRSYPPVFGSHMHVGIDMAHFHTTTSTTLPVNFDRFFSYGSSVINSEDVMTIPYKNFFFGMAMDNPDTTLRMTLNSWRSDLTNYTDLHHWVLRPAYLYGEARNDQSMTFAYPELFSVGMVIAGEAVSPQNFSQWSRYMNETWTGDKKDYGDGSVCHCDRGLPDPDCDIDGVDRSCTVGGRDGVCFHGVCKVVEWNKNKCDPKNYGDGKFCDCGCTTDKEHNDPDCQAADDGTSVHGRDIRMCSDHQPAVFDGRRTVHVHGGQVAVRGVQVRPGQVLRVRDMQRHD